MDLFSGAGGAARGYQQAGFHVTGIDIKPQPHYAGDVFIQGDALAPPVRLESFDVVHASPPCQAYSTTRTLHDVSYPDLVAEVRRLINPKGASWLYVIENVQGAPLLSPARFCGSMFGLNVRRHRLFESNLALLMPPCDHSRQPEPIDVTGTGARRAGPRLDGKGGNSRKPRNLEEARTAMGIDWMSRRELSEAVPPAFTEYIGDELMGYLMTEGVPA